MARTREFLQKQKADGRYFIQVYPLSQPPKPSTRVYLGTKDSATAHEIGKRIYGPWHDADVRRVETLGARVEINYMFWR